MFRRFLPVRQRKTASLFSPNPSSAENLANLAGADDRDSADDQDFQYHLASADDLESRHKQTAKTTRKTPNNNNSVHTKRLSSTFEITRSRREILHCQDAQLRDSGAFFCYPAIISLSSLLFPHVLFLR